MVFGALLLLEMAQAAQEPRIDFFVAFALLETLAVEFAALEQHNAQKRHSEERVCVGDLAQSRKGLGIEAERLCGRGRRDGREHIDDCIRRARRTREELGFVQRGHGGHEDCGQCAGHHVQRLAPSKSQLVSFPEKIWKRSTEIWIEMTVNSAAMYLSDHTPTVLR